ncbi:MULTISPECIES: MauE/DoxX family redox-associated membrane protein [unclassified Methylophaga]|uniref:MauE/DoxX family redox-associated membrane protein n=1 Tax=unclassified Methylophaga TaxID=2629249 RepID=UPI000C954465|nr:MULTISPECIES: MauE/DoxX family redox-associated membrane protein [unclassified Methylophaga]MBN47516.1 hypothetical protein [Methylophaga sp.]|tara:strand:+ start:46302 stop:46823 length:522 start_codon:yes stop_codon:yes gene_type:complete
MSQPAFKQRQQDRGKHLKDYWPLLALILISAVAALAICYSTQVTMLNWMHYFMGIFLSIFALLKLFHPSAFADGFQMYDLLARKSRTYAYVYPYLELSLGLGYLSFFMPQLVYALTILILGFGAIGVILALRKGLDINCPCMGSILDVPLSTVTLTEDIGMVLMALVMWMMLV